MTVVLTLVSAPDDDDGEALGSVLRTLLDNTPGANVVELIAWTSTHPPTPEPATSGHRRCAQEVFSGAECVGGDRMRYTRLRKRFRFDHDPEEVTLRCSKGEAELIAAALCDGRLCGEARSPEAIRLGENLREFIEETENVG